jgi:hypothetical protein
MPGVEINDVRAQEDFRMCTFSGYKKTKVRLELILSLRRGRVEAACNWGAELICAGHAADLWESILLFAAVYVHLGNPRLPVYLAHRFNEFRALVRGIYAQDELRLRNNSKIRALFGEATAVLCQSKQKHPFERVELDLKYCFQLMHMTERLAAPEVRYVLGVFQEEDPNELFIAANELAYHVSTSSKSSVEACYWIEWIIALDQARRRTGSKLVAARRQIAAVPSKHEVDSVWLIWAILLQEASSRSPPMVETTLKSLLSLFAIRFTPACKARRRFLLYWAISALCDPTCWSTPIVADPTATAQVRTNIDKVYAGVKQNEVAPPTDYLSHGGGASAFDRTAARLEKLDELMETGVPRLSYTEVKK